MTDKDKKAFFLLMVGMGEVFEKEPSEAKMDIYYQTLQDLSIEQVTKGITAIMRERTTASFPKPAEIRQVVEGTPTDRATKALTAFRKAMFEVGAYQDVVFEDKVIHAVCDRMGGWIHCCREIEWDYAKKDFLALYEALAKDIHLLTHPLVLMGETHANNAKSFAEWVRPPVYIGTTGEVDTKKQLPWTPPKQLQEGKP